MIKTSAVFFDGISSVPKKMEVEFDEHLGIFNFECPIDDAQTWAIVDTTIETLGHIITIQIKSVPLQFIKIEDVEFIAALNIYIKTNGHLSWYQRLINLGIRVHISIALFILGMIVLIYLYLIPWIGEKSVVLVPLKYDQEIGTNFYHQYCQYNSIDTVKTAALNQFAQHLELKNNVPLKFTVISSKEVNAFALPDGHIIVFTGILDQMKDYSELVGLLGHEVVHVNHRHTMKMICRNLSGYLFISVVLSDVNGIMAVIGDNVRNLQSLSFSRQFEREADVDGFHLMTLNQVNPRGMTNLFSRLQSRNNLSIPEFLSSHPVTQERLKNIETLIKSKSFPFVEDGNLKVLFKKIKQNKTHKK